MLQVIQGPTLPHKWRCLELHGGKPYGAHLHVNKHFMLVNISLDLLGHIGWLALDLGLEIIVAVIPKTP